MAHILGSEKLPLPPPSEVNCAVQFPHHYWGDHWVRKEKEKEREREQEEKRRGEEEKAGRRQEREKGENEE